MVEVDVPFTNQSPFQGQLPGFGIKPTDFQAPEIPSYDPFGLKPYSQQFTDFFSNFFDRIVKPTGADYGNAQGGKRIFTSNTVKVVSGSGAIGLASLGTYLTATNPGVQKTVQKLSNDNAGALSSLVLALSTTARTAETFTNFITQNPLILVGGIAVIAIFALKK